MRRWSLAHLTVLELAPPAVVSAAARAGYDAVGLRLSPVRPGEAQHPMAPGSPMFRETAARLRDTGLAVLDIEVLWLDGRRDPASFLPVLEAGAALGARHALTLVDAPDTARAAELLARMAQLAAPFGIRCALEFMPWIGIGTLASAVRVLAACGQPNVDLLPDPFHLFRSGGDAAALASALAGAGAPTLAYAQFCDAPLPSPTGLDAIADEAKFERRLPGAGALPLREFVQALPAALPLSIEVPQRSLAAVPADERARRALQAARATLHE